MENKLKYKQVSLNETKGKTVENIITDFDEFIITYTDKTFTLYGRYSDYDSYDLEDNFIKYESIVKSVNINRNNCVIYGEYTKHLFKLGIIDKEEFDKDIQPIIEELIKNTKNAEFSLYNKLKEKYEK